MDMNETDAQTPARAGGDAVFFLDDVLYHLRIKGGQACDQLDTAVSDVLTQISPNGILNTRMHDAFKSAIEASPALSYIDKHRIQTAFTTTISHRPETRKTLTDAWVQSALLFFGAHVRTAAVGPLRPEDLGSRGGISFTRDHAGLMKRLVDGGNRVEDLLLDRDDDRLAKRFYLKDTVERFVNPVTAIKHLALGNMDTLEKRQLVMVMRASDLIKVNDFDLFRTRARTLGIYPLVVCDEDIHCDVTMFLLSQLERLIL